MWYKWGTRFYYKSSSNIFYHKLFYFDVSFYAFSIEPTDEVD